MWEKIKRHWVRYLTIFVTVLIPLFAWVGGFLPTFVSAEDLQVYERRFQDLDIKQTDLAIEFKRSEREDTEEDRLRVEREIFNIEKVKKVKKNERRSRKSYGKKEAYTR